MLDRFMAKVSPEPNSGCWLWTGTVNGDGYGHFNSGWFAGLIGAHRMAYYLFCGAVPKGEVVRHTCDVPCCVNPDHLLLGTVADNVRDRDVRGRTAVGLKNGNTVLTPELVRKIRASPLSRRLVGLEIGIPMGTVAAVRDGRTWGHVA